MLRKGFYDFNVQYDCCLWMIVPFLYPSSHLVGLLQNPSFCEECTFSFCSLWGLTPHIVGWGYSLAGGGLCYLVPEGDFKLLCPPCMCMSLTLPRGEASDFSLEQLILCLSWSIEWVGSTSGDFWAKALRSLAVSPFWEGRPPYSNMHLTKLSFIPLRKRRRGNTKEVPGAEPQGLLCGC